MQVIEGLPTYGVHYYEVKDKSGLPWWLGLSYKGIGQYDQSDRVTPRNVSPQVTSLQVFEILLQNKLDFKNVLKVAVFVFM